jgi:glutathionyl-hydroquinone reductase
MHFKCSCNQIDRKMHLNLYIDVDPLQSQEAFESHLNMRQIKYYII